jgi:ATP-dependent DNA helicase RecG
MKNILEVLTKGESLEVEFKSDLRKISDGEIYEEIVAMANTNGGILLIGVDDDGRVVGCKPRHGRNTDPLKMQSAIFNNTVPNINTRVAVINHPEGNILSIEVDRYPEPCATASGKSLRRAIGSDGKPQSIPFYPRDQRSHRIDLGLLDFSAQIIDNAAFDTLDPLEFERLRQTISRLHGDKSLLDLNNEEMAKALRLVETRGRKLVPNIAALLLLGREESLKKIIPTHAVHFQFIDAEGNIKVNESFQCSLLKIFSEVELRFSARNEEKEIMVGLFRLPIPDYSLGGFREAFNNALLHRDYSRLDAVYVQWKPENLLITNPGGFPEGITIQNILVHEPKPRNLRLAEAFKRIGLVEQTGRGVDKIYLGQLRYGRPAPDYSRSDTSGVRVVLHGGTGFMNFTAFVYEQEKKGMPLSLDDMIILNALLLDEKLDSEKARSLIQKGNFETDQTLKKLHENGFIEAKNEKEGRIYHLSVSFSKEIGQATDYTRIHGIKNAQHEEMVIQYINAHKRIERKHVMELCDLSNQQAGRLLKKMWDEGKIIRMGTPPRWTYYVKKLANGKT